MDKSPFRRRPLSADYVPIEIPVGFQAETSPRSVDFEFSIGGPVEGNDSNDDSEVDDFVGL